MKRIILIGILVLFLMGAVSAEDNATLNETAQAPEIITEDVQAANDSPLGESDENPEIEIEINYPEEIYTYDGWEDWFDTDKYYISVVSDHELNGNMTIIFDERIVELESQTTYREEPDFTALGNHTIVVLYRNDTYFPDMNRTFTYEITNYVCDITDDGSVIVILPETESGTLTVSVNGTIRETQYLEDNGESRESQNTYEILLDNIQYGQAHFIEVTFNGNTINFKKSKTVNMTYSFEAYVSEEYIYYLKNENTAEFSLPYDIESMPIVFIDGNEQSYTQIDEDDEWDIPNMAFEVKLGDLNPGIHNLTVTYPGDEKYSQKTIEKALNVIGCIEALDETTYYFNSRIILNLELPEDASGNLTCEIDYLDEEGFKTYSSVEIINGNASIELPSNISRTYEFNAYFRGNYGVENYTEMITIVPKITKPSSMNFGDTGQIKVTIENTTNTRLVLYFIKDDEPEAKLAEFNLNETTTINIKNLNDLIKAYQKSSGKSTLYITPIIINENDEEFDEYGNIKINFNAKITGLSNMNIYYGDSKYINLKIYDIYGKIAGKGQSVKIKIGKKTYTKKTDKNGKIKFKIPNTVTTGKYSVVVTYKNAKVTKKLTVKQVLTLKTAKIKKSAKKLILKATIKKGKKAIKGKTIKFKFKGKTYKAKTNSKGLAKVTIKKSALKKLKVGKKITYQATYLKTTVKKTAKVKK